jgi:formamidopyrimidine-DNA glycosylase
MYFELQTTAKEEVYLATHMGLTGFWIINPIKQKNYKICMTISDNIQLMYKDDSNFGNMNLYNKDQLEQKLSTISFDIVKSNISDENLFDRFKAYLDNKRIKNVSIVELLMNQHGVVSGIGNYLMAEILYRAKISPFTGIKNLTDAQIMELCKCIKYIVKLSYVNNKTGYMTEFDNVYLNGQYINFIDYHRDNIGKLYPMYHENVTLLENEFTLKIYNRKVDDDGNKIEIDKTIQKGRSTYYSPIVQI